MQENYENKKHILKWDQNMQSSASSIIEGGQLNIYNVNKTPNGIQHFRSIIDNY